MTSTSTRSPLMRICTRVFLMCLPLLLATPSRAHAYTDPGTGAFVYQAAYAAFLGGAYYFRKFLDRFWGRRNK
jgi:hypothetical protein